MSNQTTTEKRATKPVVTRRRRGLEVVTRPGTRLLYIRGTIRGQSVFESTGTDNPTLAEEARAAREAELYRSAIHGTKPAMTFAAAALGYINDQPRAMCIKRCVNRLVEHFGPKITCDRIDLEAIDGAAKKLCRATSKKITIHRQVISPTSAILHWAADRGRCEPPKFKSPKATGRRTDWLMPSEAEALVAAASKHVRPLLEFLLCTGARMGETINLEWTMVNLQHNRVVLRGEIEGGKPGEDRGTKSGDDRIVDLPPRAVAALANMPGDRTGRVFRKPNGDPYRRTNDTKVGASGGQIRHAFATAVKNAKIVGRRLTPHHCRHTWATWHYLVHRDPYKLRDDGAWHSAIMVERYAKLAPATMLPEVLAFWGLPATDKVQSPVQERITA